ncbi:MAG: LexA family transcriptional regulator [Nitrospinae bacterium]|nr:LexA family transcriptional regulator [Nitrospinota bacterium]
MKQKRIDAEHTIVRLKAALGLRRDNQLAERLGMGKAALSERIRRNSLPLDKIKVLCAETGVNYESLFSDATSDPSPDVSGSVTIPLYEVHAPKGEGSMSDLKQTSDTLSISKRVLEDLKLAPDSVLCHYVNCDCMEPTLRIGELVAIDTSETKFIHDGSIYVLRTGNSLLLRRLTRLSAKEIEVTCDNKERSCAHASKIRLDEQRTVVGRVVMVWRRL